MEREEGKREKFILGVLVLLLVAGGIWKAVEMGNTEPELLPESADLSQELNEDELAPELISVHLVGAVQNPGVYELVEGARVYELLELGGGFREDAEKESLNQARPLFDGEQVYVPYIGEAPESSTTGDNAKININRASASELTALPGIGEVRAGQIVKYREKHGYFTEKEQVMEVSGIGEATFNNFAEMITVY
ncbi:MAG: ComEA family DNA-binding protein [Bacillota bacterium]